MQFIGRPGQGSHFAALIGLQGASVTVGAVAYPVGSFTDTGAHFCADIAVVLERTADSADTDAGSFGNRLEVRQNKFLIFQRPTTAHAPPTLA